MGIFKRKPKIKFYNILYWFIIKQSFSYHRSAMFSVTRFDLRTKRIVLHKKEFKFLYLFKTNNGKTWIHFKGGLFIDLVTQDAFKQCDKKWLCSLFLSLPSWVPNQNPKKYRTTIKFKVVIISKTYNFINFIFYNLKVTYYSFCVTKD